MTRIPESHLDLLEDETKALAVLATLMPDGSPQATPVWFDFDGESVWLNSARGRQKDRNMRARPQVALCILDPRDPYRYLHLRGRVTEITGAGAVEHLHRLARKYTGRDWEIPAGETRLRYRITIEHLSAHPSGGGQPAEVNLPDHVDTRLLRSRRSIRRFRPDPVPEALVRRLLETAVHAPSAHNLQPWRFVLVQEAQSRRRLGEALTARMRADMQAAGASSAEIEARAERSLRRLEEAPAVLLFCRDTAAVREDTPEEHHMGVQSVANAVTYLLLAARAAGLGGNWVCWPLYAPAETRAALSLPPAWEPQGMLFLGYPAEEPGEKRLRPLDDVVVVR